MRSAMVGAMCHTLAAEEANNKGHSSILLEGSTDRVIMLEPAKSRQRTHLLLISYCLLIRKHAFISISLSMLLHFTFDR